MANKKPALGNDPFVTRKNPLSYIEEGTVPPARRSDPKRAGIEEGYERYTIIARSDLIERLKDYAYVERLSLKDATEKMMADFLADKPIVPKNPQNN